MADRFVVTAGSHLYGVATPTSDKDYRGFFVPESVWDLVEVFPIKKTNRFTGEGDFELHSLEKFLYFLAGGNCQLLEIMFAPDEFVIEDCHASEWIKDNLNVFLTMRYASSLKGFANTEKRKIQASSFTLNTKDPCNKLLFDYLSAMQLKSYIRDDILDYIEHKTGVKLYEIKPNSTPIGDARKDLFEQYGYDTKAAYHTVRLLSEGIELFTTGRMLFPRAEKDLLISIRNGQESLVQINEIIRDLENKFDKAVESRPFPDKIDAEKVNQIYRYVLRSQQINELDSFE